jgi:hypothetical protein
MIPVRGGEHKLHLQAKVTAPRRRIHFCQVPGLGAGDFSQRKMPIHANGRPEAFTACWKLVRGERLIDGEEW